MKTLDVFQFKQFSVRHAKSGMKVGTDSVLLGAWADFVARNRILDVGAGTGILALMAAQRNADAMVDAVEIDAVAAEEALQNAENSAWGGRIKIFECDFLRFESGSKYDYIVSNPPFFDSGERAPDARRAMARDIANNGYVSLADLPNDPLNKTSMNTLDTYFVMQGLKTNLVKGGDILPLPDDIKETQNPDE